MGAPHIHGELLKLGITIGETSVGKYMIPYFKPPSQTWRTFLNNHLGTLVSVNFPLFGFRCGTCFWYLLMNVVACCTLTGDSPA